MAHTCRPSSAVMPAYSTLSSCEAPRFVPPPRIPVTSSTLFAYQAMRGNNGIKSVHRGPLYDALYYNQRGEVPPGFTELKANLVDLRGDAARSRLYWDPTEQTSRSEPHGDGHLRHAARTQPLPNRNHYSGSHGFANYGYILLTGVWVDPDTQAGTARALTNPQQVLPLPHSSLLSRGHRAIMTAEEENLLYDDYVTNLVDDSEGDPRSLRISPATFAQWAVGSSSGDRYETTIIPADMSPHRRIISIGRPQISQGECKPQFDIETGSMLSGEYDVERCPSPTYTAQELIMSQKPVTFSMMDPQASIDIDRAAYGSPEERIRTQERRIRTQEWANSSVASTPTTYNSQAACEELASPSNPQSGVERFKEVKNRMKDLSNELRASRHQHEKKYEIAYKMAQVKSKLARENYLIKQHLEDKQGPAFDNMPPAPQAPASLEKELLQLQRPNRGQYKRYIREHELLERIEFERQAQSSRNMDAAHETMLRSIEGLIETNDYLFTQLAPEYRAHFNPSQNFLITERP